MRAAECTAAPLCTPAPCPVPEALPWQTPADAPVDENATALGSMTATVPAWLWKQGAGTSATRALSAHEMAALRYAEHSNAQDAEDIRLAEKYFWGVAGGVILESGALDGVRMSTSLMFVKRLGWKAIHVDANPRNYARLVRNRPDALNIHAAICQRPQVVHWLAEEDPIVPTSYLTPAELESLAPEERAAPTVRIGSGVGGIFEFMPSSLIADFYPKVFAKGASAVDDMPLVTCRPLAPVLRMFGIEHVHVWVLDVEGAELEVLKAVDLSVLTVDVILVEADGGNPTKDAGVIALLQQRGFVHDGGWERSDWFHRVGFTPSAKSE